ncbi:MAG: DNA-binding protein, partial [Planctomycetaceae bacterium]
AMISQPLDQWPEEVELPGGRAQWIAAIAAVENSPDKRVFELLDSMADVLKADGKPIPLTSGYRGRSIDVDVLEACLDLGLEVPLPESFELDFDGWLRREVDHPRRNSQLTHLASEPRLMSALHHRIPMLAAFSGDGATKRPSYYRDVPPRRSFDEAAAGHPVLRDVWWQYLDKQIKAFEVGGLKDVEEASNQLLECIRPRVVAEFPQVAERLQKVDFAAILQRTFNAGVIDEYGWPALDEAADEKPLPKSSRRYNPEVFPSFPRLAYIQDAQVHVIDPQKRCPPRELKLSATQQLILTVPLGDDVMVMYRDSASDWNTFTHWLSEPAKATKQDDGYYYGRTSIQIAALAENEFFCGARSVHPGDAQWPRATQPWFHDGDRFWRLREDAVHWGFDHDSSKAQPALAEIDPRTGKQVRDSVPAFFEENLPSGSAVAYQFSYLMPCPEQQGESPVGSKHGLIGWRVVRRRDWTFECQGIDGRNCVVTPEQQSTRGDYVPEAMIDKPGTKSHWILHHGGKLVDADTGIGFGAYGVNDKYAFGQPTLLPHIFFNLMRPRCLESSKVLRKLTLKQATELLAAGLRNHEAFKKKEDPAHPDPDRTAAITAAQQALPKAPPRLIAGVARLARAAAEESVSLRSLLNRVLPDAQAQKAAIPTFDAEKADAGFATLIQQKEWPTQSHYRGQETHSFSANLMAVGKFLSGSESLELPPCSTYWFDLLDDLPSLAWRCFWWLGTNESLGNSVPERLNGPWLDALNCLADSGLLRFNEKMHLYRAVVDDDQTPKPGSLAARADRSPIAFLEGDNRYVACVRHGYPDSVLSVVGYAANAKAKPPKGMAVDTTTVLEPGWNRNSLLSFIKAVRAVRTLPLPSPEQLAAAAAMLGVHPISPALVWMGNLRTVRNGQEKLTQELRDHYGWKVKDIQTAIAELDAMELPPWVGSIGVRNNPGGAVLDGADRAFSQMLAKWAEARKKTISLPAEVLKKLDTGRRSPTNAANQICDLIADPQASELLQRRTVTLTATGQASVYHQIEVKYDPATKIFLVEAFCDLPRALAVIHYELPVGAEARVAVADVIQEVRDFLDDPSTMFPFGARFTGPIGSEPNVDETIARLGATITKLELAADGLYRGDSGLVVVATAPPAICMLFRSARLKSEKDLATLSAAVNATFDFSGPGDHHIRAALSVLVMRSEAMTRLANESRDSTLPEGSWEQDPRLSVADIVNACAKKLKVSTEAAALYLQVLALHDPTAVNVKRWNGWSTKEYAAAAKELVDAEHLVEAKRERAGRDIFLPGGWEPLKQPNLPIESWKLPLFGHANADRLRGGGADRILLLDSIAAHFQAAWSRAEQGDVPRYDEALTKKKRK